MYVENQAIEFIKKDDLVKYLWVFLNKKTYPESSY